MTQKPIRRADRAISQSDAIDLLSSANYGVLSTVGEDGLPYAIPLSFVFRDQVIYLHCAKEGRKLDNLRSNPAVSFCVVGHTKVLPGEFATEYESTIASGTASLIFGDEKQQALIQFLEKYSPDFMKQGLKFITGSISKVEIIRIDVNEISGKAKR